MRRCPRRLQAESEVVADRSSEVAGGCDVERVLDAAFDGNLEPLRKAMCCCSSWPASRSQVRMACSSPEGRVAEADNDVGGRVVAELMAAGGGVEVEECADAVVAVCEPVVLVEPAAFEGDAGGPIADLVLETLDLGVGFAEVAFCAVDLIVEVAAGARRVINPS